jgi:hypothetical protein
MNPRSTRLAIVFLFVVAFAFGLLGTAATASAQPAPLPDPGAGPPPPAPAPMPEPVVVPAPPPPPPAPPKPAAPSFKIESPNGNSIKFGLLVQPQFQAVSDPVFDGFKKDIYIRRTRVLIGGTLFGAFDYFFDTEFANMGLSTNVPPPPPPMMPPAPNTTTKAIPGMNIQDAFVTWRPLGDMVKVDAGYMLPPMSHNALQGATTLYSWDYFAYTFQHNNSFSPGSTASPVGRDTGVALRLLLLGGRIDFRAGAFQGLRNIRTGTDIESRNAPRFTARLQLNLLDAEPGFFYAGTYLGAKKILSLGGSFDIQDDYKYFAGDVFVDMPLGPGVFTAQVNVARWDTGGFITLAAPASPEQTALSSEIGFHFTDLHISPILRGEWLWIDGPDVTRLGGGVAYWPFGHNSNLKAFYTRIDPDGAPRAINQFNVQWQLYFF